MSLTKISIWTASSIFIKIVIGFIIIKSLAVFFGPIGVGLSSNFRQLLTVLGVVSGGGIYNGIIKYVAEYDRDKEKLYSLLGTASSIILFFSILLAIIFLLISDFISILLFNSKEYSLVICILAFIQIGIAYSNYFLSILKGYCDASGNAKSIIIGFFFGFFVFFLFYNFFGYKGSLVGIALIPALIGIPAIVIIIRREKINLLAIIPIWNKSIAIDLSKFTIMSIMTSITLPIAYILIRNLLAKCQSWYEVGLWSGVCMISDAYLQFVTALFSVYLLSTFSRISNKKEIILEIIKVLKFVLPVIFVVGFVIWLLREFIILLLFSENFINMKKLFLCQVIGNTLKVGSYVFGYFVIAKASLFFCFITELTQFFLLVGLSYYFIPLYGAVGATKAYMITYIIYFIICCYVFFIYNKKIWKNWYMY
ncbi:lipid III flippase WzxE [Candidatus Providencia siddallii]|uniref:Lipid III flippase n=1 Tax=Candidatus Providencia siddallii TaxID=1715285 RepID=A0ABP1CG32_9GAMM